MSDPEFQLGLLELRRRNCSISGSDVVALNLKD